MTPTERLKFFISRDPAWMGYAVYMTVDLNNNEYGYVSLLKIDTVEKGDVSYREPSMRISDESAQELMDELWRAGIRPNNGESSIAHVEAMRGHLNDMRAIVAKQLGVTLKGA